MAAEALTLSGIDAYYGDSHVLHDVSFTLGAGRVLARALLETGKELEDAAEVPGLRFFLLKRDREILGHG